MTEQVFPHLLRDTDPFVLLHWHAIIKGKLRFFYAFVLLSSTAAEWKSVVSPLTGFLLCFSRLNTAAPPLQCLSNDERVLLQHFCMLFEQLLVAGSVSHREEDDKISKQAWKWGVFMYECTVNHILKKQKLLWTAGQAVLSISQWRSFFFFFFPLYSGKKKWSAAKVGFGMLRLRFSRRNLHHCCPCERFFSRNTRRQQEPHSSDSRFPISAVTQSLSLLIQQSHCSFRRSPAVNTLLCFSSSSQALEGKNCCCPSHGDVFYDISMAEKWLYGAFLRNEWL